MDRHKKAYGEEHLKPKHHWVYDVADQMERDAGYNILLDAFVVERLHRRVKRHASTIDNLRRWEGSVLAALLNTHVESLKAPTFEAGLQGSVQQCPGFGAALMGSLAVDACGKRVAVGDVVLNGDVAGLVQACAFEEDSLLLIVRVFHNVEVGSTKIAVAQ